jgi:pyridoxal phosphate-dependent aminotransferase EpsN
VAIVEDAAEALGADYKGRAPGTIGRVGIYSFNGNKIITTSGGGMLVSPFPDLVARARKLATQAREPFPHYEHTEIGYNYRMSNVLAAIGLEFMPEASWGRHTRWLTCLTIDPAEFGATREEVRLALEAADIEARPVWKPMHLQPVFAGCAVVGGDVAAGLFEHGLCLPSGSNLTVVELQRVVDQVRACCPNAASGVSALPWEAQRGRDIRSDPSRLARVFARVD